ncbi:MAG TPA: GDP-mannose 4,6-dehydratase [Solirubrobacteraceae bacterium]|nr:GDP-mannose 4,6-dehydratase [Solirubrobacteraceae bacterium]
MITGSSGFAGRHLAAWCRASGDDVIAASRSSSAPLDLRDADATRAAVAAAAPDVVYHLAAAVTSVGVSWDDPLTTVHDNTLLTLNLLEAIRVEAPGARVICIGSGEVYGPPAQLPVDERAPLRPQNPYALSKANSDLAAGFYADAHGLEIVRTRSFNHAGPGQAPTYAISSFARQVAVALEAGESPARVVTGNPGTRRDFTDVRDVVRAYRLLAAEGVEPGVYNVCSGRTASAKELLELLGEIAQHEIDHVVDPALVRAHDVAELRGSNERLGAATGWAPEIELHQTLADTVAWWREELARVDSPPAPE